MNQTVTINGRNKNPGTYGGKIFPADFIYISVTATASRIIADMRFDHSWSKYQKK